MQVAAAPAPPCATIAPATTWLEAWQAPKRRRAVVTGVHALIIAIRVTMAATCVVFSSASVDVGAWPAIAPAVVRPFAPPLTLTCFLSMALAHLWSAAQVLRACLRKRPKTRRRGRRRRRSIVDWVDSRFGIRGRYFEHLLVGAELAEATAQSVNLVNRAASGIAADAVRSFAGLLAASCVVSPLLMQSDNVVVHTDLVVIADILFDFAMSVVWPLAWLVPWATMALRCGGLINDWSFVIKGLSLLRAMVVESAVELVAALVPFLQAHILLLELERIMRRPPTTAAVTPPRRRSRRWMRLLGLLFAVGYGAAALAVTLAAAQDRCDAQPMCQRQAYPLFSSECSCVLADAGCSGSVLDEAEFDRTVRANADSLQGVSVNDCGLVELPAALRDTELPELFVLEANDNLLETMDGVERHRALTFVHLRSNRLTAVPKFNEGGGAVAAVLLGDNPLRALRTDTRDLRNMIRFEAVNAQLGAIPCEWGALPLVDVVVSNSSVSSLPAGCFGKWEESLLMLGLNDNNISASLPFDVSGLDELALGGNPLCAGSTAGRCEPTCAPSCMPWELDNVVCNDFRCGVEECGFDAADCADSEIARLC